MNSKMKIKVGQIEIEYEGTEDFLKKEMPTLLKQVSELFAPSEISDATLSTSGSSNLELSTANIASRLGAKTGADVVVAACANLSLVQKKHTYDRKTILTEMKKATGFYKSSYSANLTGTLATLVKNNDLVQNANNAYSLHAAKAKEIAAKIAK